MGITKSIMMEHDERCHFAYCVKHNYDDISETNRFLGEQTRTLRNKYGQFERVYGELWEYSDSKDMFVPNLYYTATDYVIEPKTEALFDALEVAMQSAPATAEPLGYHNLTTDDL